MTTSQLPRDQHRPLSDPAVLRPGVRVFRGHPGTLRLCADGEPDLVLSDDPATETWVRALADGCPLRPEDPAPPGLAQRLVDRGWLVDATVLQGLLHAAWDRSGATTLVAAHEDLPPTELRQRWSARQATTVAVESYRAGARRPAAVLADAAREQGLDVQQSPTPDRLPEEGGPDVWVVVSAGEPRGSRLDALLAGSVPFLTVVAHPDRVRVGPWVVPGVTACHRCVEALHCDDEPGHALRLAALGSADEDPASPHPADGALLTMAAAWTVTDLVAYAEGRLPRTWSTTWDWGPDLATRRTRWRRHPRCGCDWGDDVAAPVG